MYVQICIYVVCFRARWPVSVIIVSDVARKGMEHEVSALKKSKILNLRIEPEAHELISRAAEISGKSVSAFMTEASVSSAQEELLNERFISVPADVFAEVSDKLAAPGVARERLVRLFESRVDWID